MADLDLHDLDLGLGPARDREGLLELERRDPCGQLHRPGYTSALQTRPVAQGIERAPPDCRRKSRDFRRDSILSPTAPCSGRPARSRRHEAPFRARLHWLSSARVAQGIERAPPEREVAGSIPAGRISAYEHKRKGHHSASFTHGSVVPGVSSVLRRAPPVLTRSASSRASPRRICAGRGTKGPARSSGA